ncbi:hypothetical protein [Streptomyces niveus]|uniref:hypothetical protein n=1 Tax=Streptomyces niveus TaxID=193462 RepID=UPI00342662AE
MPQTVLPAAQLAATAALVGWMVLGFTSRPGLWFRWKMFCRATFTLITLTGTTRDGRTEPVSVYEHLSPGSFILSPARLQTILTYLTSSGRYDRIDGHGRVLSGQGEHAVEVKNSRVVL